MKLILLFLCSVSTQILFSQNFTEVTQFPPFEGVENSSIAFADVDGDNDQDVLITGASNAARISKLYTNDGLGGFTEVLGTPFEGVSFSSIAFADVDGDNDQDVFITGQNNSFALISKLYINDGLGNFTEAVGPPFVGVSFSSIAFADVDGDNDQDILITGSNGSAFIAKLYTNDGLGTFNEVLGTPFEGVSLSSIAFADVDGDNDQDVLITGANSSGYISKLYTNDGLGSFIEVLDTPFEGISFGSIAFADVDGDNDQDLLITGLNNSSIRISKLYTNDGLGSFTEVLDTPFENVTDSSIAFADVDGDDDQDVLITGRNNSGARISKLYTNDGLGSFTEVMGTPFEGVYQGSIAFADVDGDNDQDVLITGRDNSGASISKLYTNDGTISSANDLLLDVSLELSLFPSPAASNYLSIGLKLTESDILNVRVYDLNGYLIRQQQEFAGIGDQTFIVDITFLPAGSYFIQLEKGK
ncbi:MAG: FG-GAP-like repeat-containing protein, partial [Bacteroidota bacterium]